MLARKLWGKMSLVDLADALNIPVSHARAFALEHQRRRAQAELFEFLLEKTGRCFFSQKDVRNIFFCSALV